MTTTIERSESKQTVAVEHPVALLNLIFRETPPASIDVRFWDGTTWPDEDPRPATLVLDSPCALRRMFESGTEKGIS